jgi:hypothetical protein
VRAQWDQWDVEISYAGRAKVPKDDVGGTEKAKQLRFRTCNVGVLQACPNYDDDQKRNCSRNRNELQLGLMLGRESQCRSTKGSEALSGQGPAKGIDATI